MGQGPIYNQLLERTKESIKEQVEHLKRVGDLYPEDKERYEVMVEGADTVLNILKTDGISAKNTKGWLNNLEYEQLKVAVEIANKLIAEKDDEEKVKLWAIKTDYWGVDGSGYYKTFEQATDGLINAIKNDAKDCAGKKNSLGIYPVMVRESEVEAYLAD